MSDDDISQPLSGIGLRAADIIEEGTTWVELGAEIEVSLYEKDDPYSSWHHETSPFESIFKSVLWAKTEGESVTGIADRLQENPDIAEAFGFENEDDIPTGDTFALAWRDRLEDLQSTIEKGADDIDVIATKRASPIGEGGLNPEETEGSSKRTKQRILRKTTRDVMEQMSDIVYPALDIPLSDDPIYSEEDHYKCHTVMGMENEAANNGADLNGDRLYDKHEPDAEDPFYIDGMTGETLLDPLHELDVDDVTEMMNNAAERAVKRIKPYADFGNPVFLAIDITYVAYYGDRDELDWVTGAPDNKDYSWCHKFATATIVGDNVHLVLGMLPVGNEKAREGNEYPGEENRSYRAGEVVRDLLDIVEKHVNVRCVYADRAFAAADVLDALEERDIYYVIPAPRNDRLELWLDRNVTDGNVVVEKGWAVRGPVKGGVSNERVETNLVGLPGDPYDDQYGFGKAEHEDRDEDDQKKAPVPFYTNKDLDDEIGLDRRWTVKEIERYSRRGGIETAYKKIKEFSSYTTSKNFSIRLWHFGFAVMLYNMWLIVDFLVQQAMGEEFQSKPTITAQRFLGYVRRRLDKLI